jgi:hypothetical protein
MRWAWLDAEGQIMSGDGGKTELLEVAEGEGEKQVGRK